MTDSVTKPTNIKASFMGIRRLPFGRQLGLVCGLVASITLALYLVYWVGSVDVPAKQTTTQMNSINGSEAVAVNHMPESHSSADSNGLWAVGQILFGGLLAVLLLLGVMLPVMRDLAGQPSVGRTRADASEARKVNNQFPSRGVEAVNIVETEDYDRFLNIVRNLAKDDPKRVAHHLKRWLNESSSKKY